MAPLPTYRPNSPSACTDECVKDDPRLALPLRWFLIVLVALVACRCLRAEDKPERVKAEDGFLISWRINSRDAKATQINIARLSDDPARPFVTLNVLRLVPDAMGVSVYDVSARGDLIAVAAVYKSKDEKLHPTGRLLLFNLKAELLWECALPRTRTAALLTIDDDSNIWTLTAGPGSEFEPSRVSLVVEYNSRGDTVRELLPRSQFPFHATETLGDFDAGWPQMGYASGIVWFWLPGSNDLVTISTSDGKSIAAKTGMPAKPGYKLAPLNLFREQAGDVLMQVYEDDTHGADGPAYFRWSSSKNAWSEVTPEECEGGLLIGISENLPVYLRHVKDKMSLCMADTPGGPRVAGER